MNNVANNNSETRIDSFLRLVIDQGGSDLHLISGNPPRMRVNGDIYPIKFRAIKSDEALSLLHEIMSEDKQTLLRSIGSADFAYDFSANIRFRVNVFKQLHGIGAVFRVIPNQVKSLEQLMLPGISKNLLQHKKGLILVTGPTGSGKTTTLAAMIDYINQKRRGHIITIEDPVEYKHNNKNCLVSQREVGTHTKSFADAVRSALREDPDVILVGELRDFETISLAVTAAEMGILVLGTLHTNNATSTIERIINVFPAGEEPYIRTMLSTSLCGVISQKLVRHANGRQRLAAVELLINTTAVANVIREGRPDQLQNVLQSSAMVGMQSLDTALRKLLNTDLITGSEAYKHALHKADFEQYKLLHDEPF